MARVVLQQNRVSNSAKALAEFLDIKRLKLRNSAFRPRSTDYIVNWGVVTPLPRATYINPLSAVATAACKLKTFKALQQAEVATPKFYTTLDEAEPTTMLVARTTLTGHSGEGIHVATTQEQIQAPLYSEFINKKYEYRAIVCANTVVDFKQKLKKRDWEPERDKYVWNHDNGYVFARNDVRKPEQIDTLAIAAMQALNLTYGAVDIIEDRQGNLYILEINTAFGLENTTIGLFGNKLKEHIQTLTGE